jgi:sulfur-oxidizing protein SoxY
MQDDQHISVTRRHVLVGGGSLAAGFVLASMPDVEPAGATPAAMQAAIREVVGQATVRQGKVALDVPPLVENGNTVPMTVAVESPMTRGDHVKAIHVFNEKNPQPRVISVHLGPRAGRASVSTRIRLADTQRITAIAQMSDGSFWSATIDVVVTLAACVEQF